MPSSTPPSPGAAAPARRPRLLRTGLAIAVAVAAVATLLALRVRPPAAAAKPDDAARVFEFAPGDLARMQRMPLGRRIPVSGSMKPLLQATVRSKVAAEVAAVHVQEGERVAAGAPLVTLDTADLRARYDAQRAVVAEARARLDLARKNQANSQALFEKAFISRNALETVANTVQVAEANLQSADAQAAIARRALDDAQVRAPFAGIVAKRWVNQGDKLTADMPVLALVDLSRMELEAQVPVSEIPYVRVGQEIAFHVDGFPQRAFTGKVERVNPSAEPGSRAISVFVTLPNADASLKGGMFANGTLATASGSEVDVIPVAAVQEEAGQKFAYIVKDGRIERRTLVLGTRNEERGVVAVREGLEPGALVITVKTEGMKPGASALVKAAAPARSS
jgi:membrane fusion protein, multidrug efflux system